MQSVVDAESAVAVTELLVLWQQPSTRAMLPIAVLSFDGEYYRFRYLDGVADLEGFRALVGFREFEREYQNEDLFPLFQERVLYPGRSDYGRVVQELDLDPSKATPWEQLIRTGGSSEGDTIQVTPFPRATAGGWECLFLAAGMRYFQEKSVKTHRGTSVTYTEGEFEALLSALSSGDSLEVVLEVDNTYNPSAHLLFYGDHIVGYLPDWLARLTAPWVVEGNPVVGQIVRLNESGAGWHLRLMVVISADEPFADLDSRLRLGKALRYGS
ncbi:hypothetical protein [Salinibacterium sp.]|uniref:hypothetical protein n=1 Tax=Salinibacterium sp. TaxID=1915057 RepID=UPI00286CB91C|nr:hypothetical protein [Salinibacterium sp.]